MADDPSTGASSLTAPSAAQPSPVPAGSNGVRPLAPGSPDATSERLGELLVGAGSIGILVFACLRHGPQGGAVAAALFLVIVGLVIRFPALLTDGTVTDAGVPAVSTMRISVLLIVSVFAILKAGWAAPTLEGLKIDPSWAWVLGAALGGKAVQSFAEWTGKK